jgi:DNA-binding beta-propeller fold protein YncE
MRPAIALLLLSTAPAPALEIVETGRYALNRPASLDYDPAFCGLWIANEGPEVVLVTLEGDELRRFGSDLSRIKAITLEGDNLLVADGAGGFQRLTKNGEPIGAPFSAGWADTEGLAIDEDGTIISVEDDPERLSWLSPDGKVLRVIDTTTLTPPLYEPQGIARDPRTGNLLIVDDLEGSNSLYEFDSEGNLLALASLAEYGLDPEGIAIGAGSNQMFIAFDQGAGIVSFDYTPTPVKGAEALPPGADCMMF